MVAHISILVALVLLVDRIPLPAPTERRRGRGRPRVYPDRLFLKALVIMIVRRLHRVHALLAVLDEPTPEMQQLRALLTEGGRYPARRTFQRRLSAIPAMLPAQRVPGAPPARAAAAVAAQWSGSSHRQRAALGTWGRLAQE